MKAVVCSELKGIEGLTIDPNFPEPTPGEDEVLIKVAAAGLNFPDVLMLQGKYQTQPELPFVPVGEFSGVVEAVGENVSNCKAGDEVIAMGFIGGLAEKCIAPAMMVMPKPKSLSFVQAAGVCMTYFTSYHALKQRAKLQAGETVLVLGAGGGVGVTAVELAKAMGAKVIAAASTAEKLAIAESLGADELINYSEQDLKSTVKELTGGRGVDVVYDPVGGDFSEPALRCMAWKGRFLVIGFASGPIPKIPLNLTLLKGCDIVGVFWGAFAGAEPKANQQNITELWEMFNTGKLNPVVSDIYPFDKFDDAFRCLSERRARGKVIVEIS